MLCCRYQICASSHERISWLPGWTTPQAPSSCALCLTHGRHRSNKCDPDGYEVPGVARLSAPKSRRIADRTMRIYADKQFRARPPFVYNGQVYMPLGFFDVFCPSFAFFFRFLPSPCPPYHRFWPMAPRLDSRSRLLHQRAYIQQLAFVGSRHASESGMREYRVPTWIDVLAAARWKAGPGQRTRSNVLKQFIYMDFHAPLDMQP